MHLDQRKNASLQSALCDFNLNGSQVCKNRKVEPEGGGGEGAEWRSVGVRRDL